MRLPFYFFLVAISCKSDALRALRSRSIGSLWHAKRTNVGFGGPRSGNSMISVMTGDAGDQTIAVQDLISGPFFLSRWVSLADLIDLKGLVGLCTNAN